jgi:hypothetical protein
MSTNTNEMPASAAAAVTEATRIATQAARTNTETAKASMDAARNFVGETNTLGREILATWATQSETAMKVAFDAQNAAIDAGLGLFDLSFKGNRQAVEQFTVIVKRTQHQTLESWQNAVKSTMKATEYTTR